MKKEYIVAVAGAMGAVGQEMIKTLESSALPVKKLRPLDVGGNVGKSILFRGESAEVELSCADAFEGVDIAFFAVENEVSKRLAPEAVKHGTVVIDNSSAWRMDENTPLVIPEVNSEALREHHGIIATPNCATIIALVPLKPLDDYAGIKRIIASTYQAASGAGSAGMKEMHDQTKELLAGGTASPKAFVHQIAFNVIPHIDYFEENAYTHEEMKMLHESRKILHKPELMVNCTCVRVPVYRSHSESITIETECPITPEKARELLAAAPGVKLVDDPGHAVYPMPIDTTGQGLI